MLKIEHLDVNSVPQSIIDQCQKYICIVCQYIVDDPVQYRKCLHKSCRGCSQNFKCPIDNNPRTKDFKNQPQWLTNVNVSCPYSFQQESTCQWVGCRMNLKNHYNYCSQFGKECLQCKQKLKQPQDQNHENECPEKLIQCNYKTPLSTKDGQNQICDKIMKIKDLKHHRETDCQGQALLCPVCLKYVQQQKFSTHVQVCNLPKCNNEPIGCDIKLMSPIQFEDHSKKGCPFDKIPCVLCGCLYLRKDGDQHQSYYCQKLCRTREFFYDQKQAYLELFQTQSPQSLEYLLKKQIFNDQIYNDPHIIQVDEYKAPNCFQLSIRSNDKSILDNIVLQDVKLAAKFFQSGDQGLNLINPINIHQQEEGFLEKYFNDFNYYKKGSSQKQNTLFFKNYREFLAFRIIIQSCRFMGKFSASSLNPGQIQSMKVFVRQDCFKYKEGLAKFLEIIERQYKQQFKTKSLKRGRQIKLKNVAPIRKYKCVVITFQDPKYTINLLKTAQTFEKLGIKLQPFMLDKIL